MHAGKSQDDEYALLPAAIKGPAAFACAASTVVFLAIAVTYYGSKAPGGFDLWVDRTVPGQGIPRAAFRQVVNATPLVLGGAAAIALLAVRRWRYAALAIVGPGATILVAEIAKLAVGRRYGRFLSLPSGHTAIVTSLALVATLLLVDRLRAHAALAATVGLGAATVVAGAIAVLLVALRWHYTSDTIAGYCLALATTLGVAFAVDAVAARWAGTGRGVRPLFRATE